MVLINFVEIMMFLMWLFLTISAPIVLVIACIFLILELGYVGIIGPVLLFFVSLYVNQLQKK